MLVSADTTVAQDEMRSLEPETVGDVLTPPPPPPTPLYEPAISSDISGDALTSDTEPAAQPSHPSVREQRRVPAPTEKMTTRSSHTSEGAFVTDDGGATASTVVPTHHVEEVLKRHREELSKSNTANISVREALHTRGDEAKSVIVSDLKQMLDKRVWAPVMGGKLSAMQRATQTGASTSSRPDWSQEATNRIRACPRIYPHQPCRPALCSPCWRSQHMRSAELQ